jgi:hypothetical protein
MFEKFVNVESQPSIQSHLRKEAQKTYLLIVISTFVKKRFLQQNCSYFQLISSTMLLANLDKNLSNIFNH